MTPTKDYIEKLEALDGLMEFVNRQWVVTRICRREVKGDIYYQVSMGWREPGKKKDPKTLWVSGCGDTWQEAVAKVCEEATALERETYGKKGKKNGIPAS